jgi:hypothetical protein
MKKNGTGRDRKGKFTHGNRGGPGRPPRATEAEYLAVTFGECPLYEWGAIVCRAVLDAKKGDSRAREWLSRYLLPEPTKDSITPIEEREPIQLVLSSTTCGHIPELPPGYGAL